MPTVGQSMHRSRQSERLGPIARHTVCVKTFWVAVGWVVPLAVVGSALVLVPGSSEKNTASSAEKATAWHERVGRRLQERHPLVLTYLGFVAVAVMVLVVWVLPAVLTEHPHIPKSVDRHQAISATRTGLALVLTALGAVGGLAFTARTYRLGQENLRLSHETYRLSREGHVTDRYSKAVELLGAGKIEVRLGGIYALERLMGDSPADQPTILETLAAFVREHAPPAPRAGRRAPPAVPDRPVEDVQAALSVLGRRHPVQDERPIDLSGSNLFGGRLAGAGLAGADLSDTVLAGVDLTEATLTGADLTRAVFAGADLRLAKLDGAYLTDAILGSADVTGATFNDAVLFGVTVTRSSPLSEEQIASARESGGIKWVDRCDPAAVGSSSEQ